MIESEVADCEYKIVEQLKKFQPKGGRYSKHWKRGIAVED